MTSLHTTVVSAVAFAALSACAQMPSGPAASGLGMSAAASEQRMAMMDSTSVARIGIDSLLRRRPSVVPGFMNSLMTFFTRFMPRRTQAAVANLFMTRN